MTTSPQFLESPETAKDHDPVLGASEALSSRVAFCAKALGLSPTKDVMAMNAARRMVSRLMKPSKRSRACARRKQLDQGARHSLASLLAKAIAKIRNSLGKKTRVRIHFSGI